MGIYSKTAKPIAMKDEEEIDDVNRKLDSIQEKMNEIDSKIRHIVQVLGLDKEPKKRIEIDHSPEWP